MADFKNPFRRIQVKFYRSRPLVKAAVFAMLVLSIAALLTLSSALLTARSQAAALQNQAAALEEENSNLTDKLENQGSVDSYLEVAKEELGLVDPDTIIFEPVQ